MAKNNNKRSVFYLCVTLIIILSSCASSPPPSDGEVNIPLISSSLDFSLIEEREWILHEIQRPREVILMNRESLDLEGYGDVFTIYFSFDRVSGRGAPNSYSGPYTAGSGMTIDIGLLLTTMIAPLRVREGITEHEYFALLYASTRWDLIDGRLILYSTENNAEAVLVFVEN